MSSTATGNGSAKQHPVGVVEWFHLGDRERVDRVIDELRRLDVRHLRTGVSWADWHTAGGGEWYDWLLPRLARSFEVLPCLLYTPPSMGVVPRSSSPPRDPKAFADFLDLFITRYDDLVSHVELWNEPNSVAEWDWRLDPEWHVFGEMIGGAAYWAHQRGKRTVLGGMSPVDPNWLELMGARGVLEHIDVVGIHGFPGTWEAAWEGWGPAVGSVKEALRRSGSDAKIWITEAGYSTWRLDEHGQLRAFVDAVDAPVERTYWYGAEDLAEDRPALLRFHEDEREYHFGLWRPNGQPKLLARLWEKGGLPAVRRAARYAPASTRSGDDHAVLITGGAGFIGTNLADRLMTDGHRVVIVDNLSRPGVEQNLEWLRDRHGNVLDVEVADIRDRFALRRSLRGVDRVFHFAAQVAVTTSLDDPLQDFGVNLEGTVKLLEEIRRLPDPPPLLFTSTNKVYGDLADLPLTELDTRYEPADAGVRTAGVGEDTVLSFHSPYGCSKGGADQYVLDYAKTYRLPAVVFRMSCIYGPHQFGTEDQGWVAHFLIRTLKDEPITLYGDGKQVRDILYVDDLMDAMTLALDGVAALSGRAFNMGGGPRNAVSLLELVDLIERVHGDRPALRFGPWRRGDQRYYVSDVGAFSSATGWVPRTPMRDGLEHLHAWLSEHRVAASPRVEAVAT